MRKAVYVMKAVSIWMICAFIVSGCSDGAKGKEREECKKAETEEGAVVAEPKEISVAEEDKEEALWQGKEEKEVSAQGKEEEEVSAQGKEEKEALWQGKEEETVLDEEKNKGREELEMIEADWSEYFDGFQGTAVLYDASKMQYTVFQPELALARRSPCSTFKIVSSLIALEHGIIDPDYSVRKWSGETFWNEQWNRDIDFREAFATSCVWYFRETIDEIGAERMQEELDWLKYGNCDISDWEGRLNGNNKNRALTGFWIESSLLVSPKEQTEIMERIFGKESIYKEETREELKRVMLAVEGEEATGFPVYGKTGMGKAEGVTVDAWFTGFAEKPDGNIYFCVHLGKTGPKEASSAAAKEIALRIVKEEA